MPDKTIFPNDRLFAEVTAMLTDGQTVTLWAKGNSMFPFITGGRDCVVLQQKRDLHIGDIALARLKNGRYVLHRIYCLQGGTVILMGDGNLSTTETCRREDISGVAVKILRDGRAIDCSSETKQFKTRLWRRLRPFRRYLLFICRLWAKRYRYSS